MFACVVIAKLWNAITNGCVYTKRFDQIYTKEISNLLVA